jgi:hypothetical protein
MLGHTTTFVSIRETMDAARKEKLVSSTRRLVAGSKAYHLSQPGSDAIFRIPPPLPTDGKWRQANIYLRR